MTNKYDFSGWATRNNLKCSDGRIIMKDAFKGNDGQTVPMVWNHQHNDPYNVIGHAVLENRDEGVYAHCKFNETEAGMNAKELVKHGDVTSLSIYANKLRQKGSQVFHGAIRELSLVLAGANPGAYIDSVFMHGDESDDEAVIYTGEELYILHADEKKEDPKKEEDKTIETKKDKSEKNDVSLDNLGDETLEDVLKTMNEKQKIVLYAMIGHAIEEKEKEGDNMKHNIFDSEDVMENTLSHSEMADIFEDARRYGSLKDSVLAHGIEDIDYLFPDPKNMTKQPEFIQREMGWVKKVMASFHYTPFSRIKSIFADITEDDARAKGYIKNKKKTDEIFTLLKRTTTPTTIYKKQKLDRDDVVDITDFDVVAWLKLEMRMMLDEEIARAALIGDGRLSSSDDKINELNIRPIWKDDDLYTIKTVLNENDTMTPDERAKQFIRACIKSRKDYKGSGQPSLYTTEDVLTDCLLMEDKNGRIIYESEEKLATALRVKEIVTTPVMEGATREVEGVNRELKGIVVNLKDYNIGADKGGAVNMFDDFDIDYNAQKYLIETRCSGALVKPYSAIAIEAVLENTAG